MELDFDAELVCIGNTGATEASAASRRKGVAFNNRGTPLPWLPLDADLAWTCARFANSGHILNAVDRVVALAASLRDLGPWSASLQKPTWTPVRWSKTTACARYRRSPPTCASAAACSRCSARTAH